MQKRQRAKHRQKRQFAPSKSLIYLASALAPMLIMLVVWIFMKVFPFGHNSLMAVDFGQQYIGLYAFLKNTVLTGDWSGLFYSFSKSIGGAMIGIWGFNLISPFNLLYILLPLGEFKWAIFLTIWLRYGATGLAFAHLLIKRYKGAESRALLTPIMATAYALSGMIVSYQMNPIFYDAMIMLPLVILALEEVLDGSKPYKYMALLASTMALHFYMGYMICLFVAIYTFYYLAPKLSENISMKERLKNYFLPIFKTVIFSILGVLMTMVLLLPIFLNLLRSKGAYESSMLFQWTLQINPLDIIAKTVIGGFDNESWPAGPNLPNIYVGGLALIGYFAYFRNQAIDKTKKIGAAIVSLIFLLSFAHEFTNKIWHMGQTPAGFFYRFSWIVSFFMVLLAYQALKEKNRITLLEKLLIPVTLVASLGHTTWKIKNYSFLSMKQPEVVTKWVTDNRELTYLALGFLFILAIAYIWKAVAHKVYRGLLIALVALAFYPALQLLQQGWLLMQLPLTLITWLLAFIFIYLRPKGITLALMAIVTSLELGYNAYLSQARINYDDAYKFTDATLSIQEVIQHIDSLEDGNDFYRVASSFYYAKNDPFLLDYNGLSNFSSNMEKSTIDLFGWLGDVGGNAATFYANGNGLTDTLYGVRYYIDTKPYTNEDLENNPRKRYFSSISKRADLGRYFTKIFENDQYILYKRNTDTSIAFATNPITASIKFGQNNPTANQNIILQSMSGQQQEFFQKYAFQEIVLSNMEKVTTNGLEIYRRIDKTQSGEVQFKVTPQANSAYYVLAPYSLRKSKGNIDVLLNNNWYTYTQSYDQMQLWNLTYQTAGQPLTFTLRTSTEDEIDLTGMALVRAENDAIDAVVNDRLKQSMDITSWGNNFINGKVTISDESSTMLTTIPYNPGWKVKVNGHLVETKEVWGSLLSFPISAGEHDIEMVFIPDGFYTGLIISLVTIGAISIIWFLHEKIQIYRD